MPGIGLAHCVATKRIRTKGPSGGYDDGIFEQAFATDVWLGVHANDSPLAMNLNHELDGVDNLIVIGEAVRSCSPQAKYDKGIKWVNEKLIDPAYRERWNTLQFLMRRTYWSRLWIIQEAVVTACAERVRLLCGDRKALFKHLYMLIELIYVISYLIPLVATKGSWQAQVHNVKRAGLRVMVLCDHATGWQATKMGQDSRHNTGLLRLLSVYCAQLCSDQRDRVHALLGQYKEHKLPISYSASVKQVYQNTAK